MAKKQRAKHTGRIITGVCLVAILIFGLAGWAWWRHVYNDPERAFWDMLSNSLSTASVTRHTTQTGQGSSLDQITRLNLGGQSAAHGLTTVTQPSAAGTDTAITESIGTIADDYARYISIQTLQKNHSGKPLNFDNVLGLWGKTESTAGQPSAQFLSSTILNVIPFAPLNDPQRQPVLQTMHDIKMYDVDYSKAMSRTYNGRDVFVYSVTINASAYIATLKTLAHQLGLNQLDKLDPAAYASSAPQQLEVTVDKLSHQLLSINYPAGLRHESYSGFGLQASIPIPTSTIPISELQKRLQAPQ